MVSISISNKPLIRCRRRFGIINKKLFKERDFQKPEGSGKGSMVYTFVITYIVHFKSVHLTPCELYLGEGNGNPLQYSVLLPGESHGWRSLVGCSPWGR